MTEDKEHHEPSAPAPAAAAEAGPPKWLLYGFAAKIALVLAIVGVLLWYQGLLF